MRQTWQQWNRRAQLFLWVLTLIGVIAAIPVGAARWELEKTAKQVEFVFDYRDLVQIASYQAHPEQFIKEQLVTMKETGIHSMAVFESSLQDLSWSGRLTLYNSEDVSNLMDKPKPTNEKYTYLLFAGSKEEAALRPVIEATFQHWDLPVAPGSYDGTSGLVIETPVENAVV